MQRLTGKNTVPWTQKQLTGFDIFGDYIIFCFALELSDILQHREQNPWSKNFFVDFLS